MLKRGLNIHKNKAFIKTLLFMFMIFSNCMGSDKVDVSDITIQLTLSRFEQDIFAIPFDEIEKHIPLIEKRYKSFFEIFNQAIIKIGTSDREAYPEYLKMYVTDYSVNRVYTKSQEVFPDLSLFYNELLNAFKHFRYYFPQKPIPEVYTFIGRDFNHASIVTDANVLAIAIDKYLGMDCELYYQAGFYHYMIRKMVPEMMVSDCMRGWAMTEFEFHDSVNNVLHNMIYEGRNLYLVHKLLPETPDTLITGFTSGQLQFCRNNEKMMWCYMVENKILFSTDYLTINKFIKDGPFTKDFTSESPARAAVWLGWRIVESYMKAYPETPIRELMEITNYQYILEHSHYNP